MRILCATRYKRFASSVSKRNWNYLWMCRVRRGESSRCEDQSRERVISEYAFYRALESGLSGGYSKVVILGSDSPTLPAGHIRFLLTSDADVVLGPTVDGGYYGIACYKVMPRMFQGVRWSTANALRDTIVSIGRCGLSYAIGLEWYDIDRPEDLGLRRNSWVS